MKKRGISPIVGTIIIVLITVTIAAVLVTLGQRLVTTPAEESETKITKMVSCIETSIKINDVCHDSITDVIKLQIENSKVTEITGLFLRIYDGNLVNTASESDIGNWANLQSLQVRSYNVSYTAVSALDRIEVFPKILLKGAENVCVDQFKTFGGPPNGLPTC